MNFFSSLYAPLILGILLGVAYLYSPQFKKLNLAPKELDAYRSLILRILLACVIVVALMRVRLMLSPGFLNHFGVVFNAGVMAVLIWGGLEYNKLRRLMENRPSKPPPRERARKAPPPSPPPPPPNLDAYNALGLPATASKKQVTARYRELVGQFHPDRLRDAGPDMQKMAHEKLLEIQRAYEILTKKS